MENLVPYKHITLIYSMYQNEVEMHVPSHGLVLH